MPHIIVVEDDPGFREVLVTQIEDMGFRVTSYADGAAAKTALSLMKTAPDFMILDLVLPKVTGEVLLQWIRQHPRLKPVPVVILTGNKDDKSLKTTLKLGVRDFLLKPVPEALLRGRLSCLNHELESNDARAILSQCQSEDPNVFESKSFKRFRNKGYRPYKIAFGHLETIALCSTSFTTAQLMMLDEDLLSKHLRIYHADSPWLPIWPRARNMQESRSPSPLASREKMGDELFSLVESCANGENTRTPSKSNAPSPESSSSLDSSNSDDNAA